MGASGVASGSAVRVRTCAALMGALPQCTALLCIARHMGGFRSPRASLLHSLPLPFLAGGAPLARHVEGALLFRYLKSWRCCGCGDVVGTHAGEEHAATLALVASGRLGNVVSATNTSVFSLNPCTAQTFSRSPCAAAWCRSGGAWGEQRVHLVACRTAAPRLPASPCLPACRPTHGHSYTPAPLAATAWLRRARPPSLRYTLHMQYMRTYRTAHSTPTGLRPDQDVRPYPTHPPVFHQAPSPPTNRPLPAATVQGYGLTETCAASFIAVPDLAVRALVLSFVRFISFFLFVNGPRVVGLPWVGMACCRGSAASYLSTLACCTIWLPCCPRRPRPLPCPPTTNQLIHHPPTRPPARRLQSQAGTVGPPQPVLSFRLEAVPSMNYDPLGTPAR